MIRVASLDDPRVALYRELANPEALIRAGVFVAEGRLVVARLLRSSRFTTQSVMVTEAARTALAGVLDATAPEIPIFVADQAAMNEIVGFNIHRGCLALAERPPRATLANLDLAGARRLLVLEGVNNPDNVGGLFRSAAALGTDAVVLGPACGDPLYRKAVRTSMAAALAVPFVDAGAWPDALATMRDAGWHVIALTPSPDARTLDEVPRALARVALLVGAEGPGLSEAALALATIRARIPMNNAVDSLNVTVAASIALHYLR